MKKVIKLYLKHIKKGGYMSYIGVLGSKGTFSEIAAKTFLNNSNNKHNFDIKFFPTITEVIKSVLYECDLAIVPIENSLDGYVEYSIDSLLKFDLKIIDEIKLPIQFAFISNNSKIQELKNVYVQFKVQGQCINFLEENGYLKVITTYSNTESLEMVSSSESKCIGGIIPTHLLESVREQFPLTINNITDSDDNITRFAVISSNLSKSNSGSKMMICIKEVKNNPGELMRILQKIHEFDINIMSIISRPTRNCLGTYDFILELDISKMKEVDDLLITLQKLCNLVILGYY